MIRRMKEREKEVFRIGIIGPPADPEHVSLSFVESCLYELHSSGLIDTESPAFFR